MRPRLPALLLGVVVAVVVGVAIAMAANPDETSDPLPEPTTSSTIASTSSTRPSAAFQVCSHDQLDVGLGGHDGATGNVLWTFVVANRGAPCSLEGWASLVFLDADGQELPIATNQHLTRVAAPVDLYGTDRPFVVNQAPLVEAAKITIETTTDRGGDTDVPTFEVDAVQVRLPGVAGLFTVSTPGVELADTVLLLPLVGPQGTIRD